MKLNDLNTIMEKHNIWKHDYCINEGNKPLAETALCLMKTAKGFEYYVSERNVKHDIQFFRDENEACRAFLADMAYSHPVLKQYISAS